MKTLFSLNLADDIIGYTTIENNPGQTSTVVNDRIQRYTTVIRPHVIRRNMVVNDRIFLVYGRIRSFTESVTFDLGSRVGCKESLCEHF